MPYSNYFGGVTMFSNSDFYKLNGYSNTFWGWGGEDDEMYNRVIEMGMGITRIGNRYLSLPHQRKINKSLHATNVAQLSNGRTYDDGLLSCEYSVIREDVKDGYTILTVAI